MPESETPLQSPTAHVDSDPVAIFNSAFTSNDLNGFRTAWDIARENLGQESQHTPDDPWMQREAQAFNEYAHRIFITDTPEDYDERIKFQAEVEGLFGMARFRRDGLSSEHPSIASRLIAERMIRLDLEIPGREAFAIQSAEWASLGEKRIEEVRKQATRNQTAQARAKLRANIAKHPLTKVLSSMARGERALERFYVVGARALVKDSRELGSKVLRRITGGSSIGRR